MGRRAAFFFAGAPAFFADAPLFCPVGRTPQYLGQPVALLIFDTFDQYDQARIALRRLFEATLRHCKSNGDGGVHHELAP